MAEPALDRQAMTILRSLLARGGTPGPWSDEQTRRFEAECSEWIGTWGDDVLAYEAALSQAEQRAKEAENERLLEAGFRKQSERLRAETAPVFSSPTKGSGS